MLRLDARAPKGNLKSEIHWLYKPNSLPTATSEFYVSNCVDFFVAWRTQLSKTVKEINLEWMKNWKIAQTKASKHTKTCKKDCYFLCLMYICFRTCVHAYTCSFAAFFIECIFAEVHYCAESARVVVHHLQSTEIQIWFIIAEGRNFI